jgi:hypothetical protein
MNTTKARNPQGHPSKTKKPRKHEEDTKTRNETNKELNSCEEQLRKHEKECDNFAR